MDNKAKDRLAVKTATANVDKRKADIADIAPIGKSGGGVAQSIT